MTAVLTDDDLLSPALMPAAIEAVEASLKARAAGRFVSPPRHAVPFGDRGNLFFTVGGSLTAAGHAGFRVYDTFTSDGPHTQIVAVWSIDSAELECVVLGSRLGEIRTGAIGGVAIRHMSSPYAQTVGIIGSGRQARMQLEAAAAVRSLRQVRIFSPNPANRARFAEEMGERLNLSVQPVATAKEAVDDAQIVICATTSRRPVLEGGWLRSDAHVTTVGPKTMDGHEIGLDVAEWPIPSLRILSSKPGPTDLRSFWIARPIRSEWLTFRECSTGRRVRVCKKVSRRFSARLVSPARRSRSPLRYCLWSANRPTGRAYARRSAYRPESFGLPRAHARLWVGRT